MRLYLSVTRAVLFLHHGSYASAFSHVTWISNSFCWRHKKEGSGEAKMVGTSMVPPSDSSKDIHKPKNAVKGKSCIGEESQPLHALKPTISYNGPWSLKKIPTTLQFEGDIFNRGQNYPACHDQQKCSNKNLIHIWDINIHLENIILPPSPPSIKSSQGALTGLQWRHLKYSLWNQGPWRNPKQNKRTHPADFGETLFCLKDLKKGLLWGDMGWILFEKSSTLPFYCSKGFCFTLSRLEVHQPMVHNQEHPNPISPLRLHFAPFACWKPNPNHRKVKGKVKVGGPVAVSFQLECLVLEIWRLRFQVWMTDGRWKKNCEGKVGSGKFWKSPGWNFSWVAWGGRGREKAKGDMWVLLEEIWVERFRSTSDFRKLRFVVTKSLKSLMFQIYSKSWNLISKSYNKPSGLKET